jgi:hypothetical protein
MHGSSAASVDVRGESRTWHTATLGEGAWVVVVDGGADAIGIPPIRMLDAAGTLASRADPAWLDAAG